MHNFALEEIEEIKGRLKFHYLIVDGTNYYETFEEKITKEGNYQSELNTVQTRMQLVAEGQLLPKEKYRDITPAKAKEKEYEIKTKNLRVYLFHEEKTGHVIVCAGQKNNQKKD